MILSLAGRQGRAFIVAATRPSITSAKLLAHPISTTSTRLNSGRSGSGDGNIDDGMNDFRHSEDMARERYDLRANEDVDRKRARLLYQSKKRGMLENGVILSSFADKYLDGFDAEQLDQYDRLINLPTNDWDIFYWATKTKPCPPEFETAVMQKLRSHLNKKVSKNVVDATDNDAASQDNTVAGSDGGDRGQQDDGNKTTAQQQTRSIFDGKRSDDIPFPASKDRYELDIDPNEVDLVNYPRELFDERTKRLRGNNYILRMTKWRKEFFERRLRRVISSPVSVRNLSDDKETPVYTQKVTDKSIASHKLESNDLLDSETERSLKHHNFVQYLLSHEFTDQLDEYEWEAEAWSNTLWHRNYGKSDVNLAPSKLKCSKCQVNIHCCDPGLDGYVPKELFAKLTFISDEEIATEKPSAEKLECQRCTFKQTYGINLDAQVDKTSYDEMVKKLKDLEPSVICLVVDLTDFPSGVVEGLIDLVGTRHKFVIVGNKLDLLPIDGPNMIGRVSQCLKSNLARLRPGNRNLHIQDPVVLSARTGFGLERLVSKLLALTEFPKDVYLLGCANSGKSTLFNALLQSDLSAVREVDLLARVSGEEHILGSGISLLKFPLSRPDGWEIELKKRRSEIALRYTDVLESSLKSTTQHRQATVPHMSMLIDRLGYPADTICKPVASIVQHRLHQHQLQSQTADDAETVNFSDDHPFQKIEQRDLLSATKENLPEHPFLYQTPSLVNGDQLHDLLTNEERLEVFPHETIVPRQYTLRPLQSLFIAGLARLDLLTATSYATITVFASKYLPIHAISTRKADEFYDTFLGSPYLGVPFGGPERLGAWPKLVSRAKDKFNVRRRSDIVLSSAGWALVQMGPDQECIVRAWTPEGRGIYYRWPPLLAHGGQLERGKKIRDTPIFMHPHFSLDKISVPASADRR